MWFAQYSPAFSPGELFAFAGIAVFVLFAVVLARKVFGHEPPLHKEYVGREEHSAFVKKMDEELGRERGQRKKIHEEIATLQTGVEIVKSQNSEQSERIRDMRADQLAIRDRIDDLPRRTIELLRNSGALK